MSKPANTVSLPKWAEEAAANYINECCYRKHSADFLAGVRLVLERLEATKAKDVIDLKPRDRDIDYNLGRESVRQEVWGECHHGVPLDEACPQCERECEELLGEEDGAP